MIVAFRLICSTCGKITPMALVYIGRNKIAYWNCKHCGARNEH